jgi:hypothetical protein
VEYVPPCAVFFFLRTKTAPKKQNKAEKKTANKEGKKEGLEQNKEGRSNGCA